MCVLNMCLLSSILVVAHSSTLEGSVHILNSPGRTLSVLRVPRNSTQRYNIHLGLEGFRKRNWRSMTVPYVHLESDGRRAAWEHHANAGAAYVTTQMSPKQWEPP